MAAKLTPIASIPQDNRESLDELLEQLRSEVEAGTVSSIAVAVVYRSGEYQPYWSNISNFSTQIGAIERLKYRLLIEADS